MKRTNGFLALATAVVGLMLTATSVHASSITYDFVGTGSAAFHKPPEPVAFQLTVSNFVNPPLNAGSVFFPCSELDSSTNCYIGVWFSQSNTGGPSLQDYIAFDASNNAGYLFYFPVGSFGTPGSYTATRLGAASNRGTLTVTETPEPATILLAFGGVCFCGLRRLLAERSTAP